MLFLLCLGTSSSTADPTEGFTAVPLTEANFELQKPYDIPLSERYSFENGIRRLWVYADDKPHDPNSRTQPRTEVRIKVSQESLFFSFVFFSSQFLEEDCYPEQLTL